MTLVVGPAGQADVAAALRVFAPAEGARRGSPVDEAELGSMAARLRAGGWLLLARDEDDVLGVVAGFDARAADGAGPVIPGLCHLSLVMVVPDRWGEGIGRSLVDGALAEARRRGYDRIQLWTHEDNVRAQRLYTSRGFRRDGRTKSDDRGELIGLWSRRL